jgi:hypothetical protein
MDAALSFSFLNSSWLFKLLRRAIKKHDDGPRVIKRGLEGAKTGPSF